jgi:hypothetical protein
MRPLAFSGPCSAARAEHNCSGPKSRHQRRRVKRSPHPGNYGGDVAYDAAKHLMTCADHPTAIVGAKCALHLIEQL